MTSTELFNAYMADLKANDIPFELDEWIILELEFGTVFVSDFEENIFIQSGVTFDELGLNFASCRMSDPILRKFSWHTHVVGMRLQELYPMVEIVDGRYGDIIVQWLGLPESIEEIYAILQKVLEAVAYGRKAMELVIRDDEDYSEYKSI